MKLYCVKFDAYYDKQKDVWLEEKCTPIKPLTKAEEQMACYYNCWDRPDRPSEVDRTEQESGWIY